MPQKRGWFTMEGRLGDRTLEQQMMGLAPLLKLLPGKSVLDLGCAEGLISMEAARVGARQVDAVDYHAEFIDVAAGLPVPEGAVQPRFVHYDLQQTKWLPDEFLPKYDVILALAVIHKMTDPRSFAHHIAEAASDLVVVRLPKGSNGLFRGKHSGVKCDLRNVLVAHGFRFWMDELGPNRERVHYWKRR